MSKWKISAASLLLWLAAAYSPTSTASTPPAGAEPGYIIDMTTVGCDRYRVQVTAKAIRVDLLNAGTTVVSTAPKWDITAYRNDEKRILFVSKDDWRHKYKLRKLSWASELKLPRSKVAGSYKGLPTVRCNYAPTDIVGLYMQTKVGAKDEHDEFNQPYVVCLLIENGSESGAALAGLHSLPALPGLPLEVKRKRLKGNTETTIDTTNLVKAEIPSSVFAIPNSYQPANFRESFFISHAQTQNTKELFDAFLH
jgi:hypothetical protein